MSGVKFHWSLPLINTDWFKVGANLSYKPPGPGKSVLSGLKVNFNAVNKSAAFERKRPKADKNA